MMRFPGVVTLLEGVHVVGADGGIQRSVRCGACAETRVRLVAVGWLAVVWCRCGHLAVDPDITADVVSRQLGPAREDARWTLDEDGLVPEILERRHPGIQELLRSIGREWLLRTGLDPVPDRDRRHSRREWDAAADALAGFLDERSDTTRDPSARADEVVLVPMTRREIRMLRTTTYRPDRSNSLVGRILGNLALDLHCRAAALVAADGDHVRHVVAQHASGVHTLLGLAHCRTTARRRSRSPDPGEEEP